MKIQEVILRAISKQINWLEAAEIIGISPRSMRRWKRPSPRRVPLKTVERVLGLYRERYFDFNVMHFVEKLHSEHEIALSYSWVKKALQEAGLVAKAARRGKTSQEAASPAPGGDALARGRQQTRLASRPGPTGSDCGLR